MTLPLAEIRAHPAFSTVISLPEPDKKGTVTVAKSRGGPFNVAYQIYGKGGIHLVARRAKPDECSGVERGDKFSSLVFDNRGVGDSDKPFLRYSTSEMARDLLELLEDIGWAKNRSVHLIGVSMGGMIAMEFTLLAPHLIASLTLQSTAASLKSSLPWYQQLVNRITMFLPKPEEMRLRYVQAALFSKEWLEAPDDLGEFPTNADRFVAEELWRAANLKRPVWIAYLLQGLAASGHDVSSERLQKIGGFVGGDGGVPLPVLVLTGTKDRMIEHSHSEEIVAGINSAGESERARLKIFEGAGHVVHWEAEKEYNSLLETQFMQAESALDRKTS
ncbi:Alpha/Beta hydrolase protein [Kalaharituber pfeilii]|nr:Alpha/Beta hydrolase protein [Kalaharituber pfeilii]